MLMILSMQYVHPSRRSSGAAKQCSTQPRGPLILQPLVGIRSEILPRADFLTFRYPIENQNGPIKVFPSYSAYLFVAETLGHSKTLQVANIYPGRQANGSSITTAGGDTSSGQLVAYGFWDAKSKTAHDSPTKLALLNLQIFNQTQADTTTRPRVLFDISAYLPRGNGHDGEVRVRRLTAPGADIKEGNVTSWAGQTFGEGVASGRLVEERVRGGKIAVEASEAVLVFL